jgi:predicted nuclease with TOPRIM domain
MPVSNHPVLIVPKTETDIFEDRVSKLESENIELREQINKLSQRLDDLTNKQDQDIKSVYEATALARLYHTKFK